MRQRFRVASLLSAVLLAAPSALSANEGWVQVRTPNFLVISDGTDARARNIALDFEQIRQVFAVDFHGLRTESGAQTIILAPKNGQTMKELVPVYWEQKNISHPKFLFIHGWETNYALIEADTASRDRTDVYHEYIHELIASNFTRIPSWLNEGLAEFYGNTKFEDGQTLIGARSHLAAWVPSRLRITAVTSVTSNPFYSTSSGIKVVKFYAQCWALTHFLILGDGMGKGQRMSDYLRLLQQGTDAAFEQAFGDLADVQRAFDAYLSRSDFPTLKFDQAVTRDESGFSSQTLSQANSNAILAGFYIRSGELDRARGKLAGALAANPNSALAHENMTILDLQEGDEADAARELDQAVALNPDSYLAVYYQAMESFHAKTDAESLDKLDQAMQRVTQLNPRFAPPWAVRSQIDVRREKLQEALDEAEMAQRLEPNLAGYLTNVAAILVLRQDFGAAIKITEMVASRWSGGDVAEALSVEHQARQLGKIAVSADEQAREANQMHYAAGTQTAGGMITAVSCKDEKLTGLTLQTDEKSVAFLVGADVEVSWSDLNWLANHINVCRNIKGMTAVVRYKASIEQTGQAELRQLEIRDGSPLSVPTHSN